jgi:hypothetical protein
VYRTQTVGKRTLKTHQSLAGVFHATTTANLVGVIFIVKINNVSALTSKTTIRFVTSSLDIRHKIPPTPCAIETTSLTRVQDGYAKYRRFIPNPTTTNGATT